MWLWELQSGQSCGECSGQLRPPSGTNFKAKAYRWLSLDLGSNQCPSPRGALGVLCRGAAGRAGNTEKVVLLFSGSRRGQHEPTGSHRQEVSCVLHHCDAKAFANLSAYGFFPRAEISLLKSAGPPQKWVRQQLALLLKHLSRIK